MTFLSLVWEPYHCWNTDATSVVFPVTEKLTFLCHAAFFVCRRYEALSKLEWLHTAGHQGSVQFYSCSADDAFDWHESWWWDLHIFNSVFAINQAKKLSIPCSYILIFVMGESHWHWVRAKELNTVRCPGGFHLFINLWAAWEVIWVVWAWRTSSLLLRPRYCPTYDDWKGICKSTTDALCFSR